jgi:hypothetical protein
MIADKKKNRRKTGEAPPVTRNRLWLKHDYAKINGQNMYEGRATDLEATIASLCACETLSGRAS